MAQSRSKTAAQPAEDVTSPVAEVTDAGGYPTDEQWAEAGRTADDSIGEPRPAEQSQVATTGNGNGEITTPPGGWMNFVTQYLADKAQSTEDEDAVITEAIAERIMMAEDLDQVLDPLGTLKSEQLLGKPLLIHGFRVLHSDVAEGYPYYALLDVQLSADQPHKVVSIGGQTVLIQLVKLDIQEAFPQMLCITQAKKPTKRGFFPLQLERPVKIGY